MLINTLLVKWVVWCGAVVWQCVVVLQTMDVVVNDVCVQVSASSYYTNNVFNIKTKFYWRRRWDRNAKQNGDQLA